MPDAYRVLLRCPWCQTVMTTTADQYKAASVPPHELPERQAGDVGGTWMCRGSGKDVEPMGWQLME